MKSKKDFLYALDQVRQVVLRIVPDDLERQTPDTEWVVRDLLQHMLSELAQMPHVVVGETPGDIGDRYGGDLVGGNPIAKWRGLAVAASEAVRRCEPKTIAHLRHGDMSVREYLQDVALDQLIHAWDLGQAIDVPVHFDETIAKEMYRRMLPRKEALARSGAFGTPIEVDNQATAQVQLLALLGRDERWRERH